VSALYHLIAAHVWLAWLVLLAAFAALARSTDVFVASSVGISTRLRIPRLIIGLVLVSFATTAPELSVSVTSALRGKTDIALGNAMGSVICNTGLALALCAMVTGAAVPVIPHVLASAGAMLLGTGALCFLFVVRDATLGRPEGAVLLALFFLYIGLLYVQHKRGVFEDDVEVEAEGHAAHGPLWQLALLFVLGLGGIILSSSFIVTSSTAIARWLGVPEAVIAMTLVALGTSIPEVATSVTAARRGHGALAVGNILGANIMDICWVAGASAAAKPLSTDRRSLMFMFLWMLALILISVAMLRVHYRLSKRQGVVLVALYMAYLASLAAAW